MAVLAGRRVASGRLGWRAGLLDAGPLAVAGIVANGGSLLVTLVLARLLTPRDYGALNQLIGVFFVVSTPGSAVLVGVVRRVTRWTGSLDDVPRWGSEVHRRAMLALVLFSAAVLAAGPSVASLLGRHGASGFDAVAIAGGVWVFLCVDRGLLQAHREYRTLSANLLLEGGARTAFMIVLGVAGLGVSGVAAGVLVAEVCTAAHARLVARRAWRTASGAPERRSNGTVARAAGRGAAAGALERAARGAVGSLPSSLGSWHRVHALGRVAFGRVAFGRDASGRVAFGRDGVVRRDLVAAVGALAAIAVLQNVDVIVMGREAPRAVGSYAAVSVSSKALVFVAIALSGYLLPEAAISWRDGGHALRQLSVSLAVLAVPAALLVGVAAAMPRLFLSTAFSNRYVSAAGAFLPLALAMVCLSVTVIVTMYLLGVGDRRFVAVLATAAALATAAVALAEGAPRTTALADLAVQGFLLCAAGVELARVHRTRLQRSSGPAAPRDDELRLATAGLQTRTR